MECYRLMLEHRYGVSVPYEKVLSILNYDIIRVSQLILETLDNIYNEDKVSMEYKINSYYNKLDLVIYYLELSGKKVSKEEYMMELLTKRDKVMSVKCD